MYIFSIWKDNSTVFRQNIRGFIIISDTIKILRESIYQTYTLFPNSKIILVLTNHTSATAERLINIGWYQFKELNTIALIREKNYDKDSQEEGLFTYEVHFLNPFLIQQNGKRGQLTTIRLTDGNSQYKTKVFLDLLKKNQGNVHGYPFKILMRRSNNSHSMQAYGRITSFVKDNEIMSILVQVANFTPVYLDADAAIFGNTLENGTVTGSLREIENSHADILGDLRPIQNYGQKHSVFLFPPDQTAFAFLTPEMGTISTVSFLQIFHHSIFVGLVILYGVMVIIWKVLEVVCATKKRTKVLDVALILFRAVLVSPQKEQKLVHQRVLVTTLLIFSMIISYSYQGKMVQVLMGSKMSLNVDTIDNLANSNLKILTTVSFEDILKDIANNELGEC